LAIQEELPETYFLEKSDSFLENNSDDAEGRDYRYKGAGEQNRSDNFLGNIIGGSLEKRIPSCEQRVIKRTGSGHGKFWV
jgi:hypothetical protein